MIPELVVCFIALFTLRLFFIYCKLGNGVVLGKQNASVLAIAGSGGHTTELLRLVSVLQQDRYKPRHYVVALSDGMSSAKISAFENERKSIENQDYFLQRIPRSREVSQSWITSVGTTFYALLHSFPIVLRTKPDIILCNGPGTCIPLCAVGFLFKILGISNCQIIFVESFCRIQSLSLSGKILYYFADKCFVQWPALKEKYPKTEYMGRIV